MIGRRAAGSFFGRRHGKSLRPSRQRALEELLPDLRVDISRPPPRADLSALFSEQVSEVLLEIGFGGGEHLLAEVAASPATGFIGVEPFVNGMARLLGAVSQDPPGNLRVFDEDATRLLDWLPKASLSRIDLLYPDPWPKRKHWKRRFVNADNLDRFARVLRPGGMFRCASDIGDYINWTLLQCHRHPGFVWIAASSEDWTQSYPGWPGTRYEAKARREGRTPAYLSFRRTG